MPDLELELARADVRWGAALGILQSGFWVVAREGISPRSFMRTALGFPDEYIESEVSTVFLDDKPVDDIDGATLVDGSRLALSAAMPGLVGAVMRRHSPYAAFRETISHRGSAAGAAAGSTAGGPGMVAARAGKSSAGGEAIRLRVKLFNSVMRDRGPEVLAKGIFLDAARAGEQLAALSVDLPARDEADHIGGSGDEIFLRVREAQR